MTEVVNNVVRMRGLPWSATEEDVKTFFDPIGSNILKISFTLNSNGRKSGEAYVEFQSEGNVRYALTKNNFEMGKRYIEVFAATRAEMDYVTTHVLAKQKNSTGGRRDLIVRLRGLPYGCSEDDVAKFFSGLQLAPHGILFIFDERGRQSGECFVKFVGADDFETALQKDKDTIGHRYIEVFPSSYVEAEKALKKHESDFNPGQNNYGHRQPHHQGGGYGRNSLMQPLFDDWPASSDFGPKRRFGGGMDFYGERFSPYNPKSFSTRGGGYGGRGSSAGAIGGGGGAMMKGMVGGSSTAFFERRAGGANATSTKNNVTVRGLPFNCGLNDIVELFHPLKIAALSFMFDDEGRPSGEASVQFINPDDVAQALDRNGAQIGGRYVDIYSNSESDIGSAPAYPMQGGGGTNATWFSNNGGGNDFFSFGE